ncbi:MAG: TRAP transporter substrate-binding protein DctP [Rhodospirillales bacterium]|nr:TRAP transporter substrate-binding protein DctP [Rhodospirillales bacterium]
MINRLAAFAGAAALGLCSSFIALAADASETLRISLQLPLKSHLGQNLLLFKEAVEANSDMTVEIYDSAQLFKDKEVPEAVASGQIEMGVASLTRFVGEIPAVDVFYMPFVLNSEEKVRKAAAPGSAVRGPLDKAMLETGARPLWWQAYGGVILLSNGGPIETPEAVKDRKVRVFGKTLGTWIQVLGGVPTLISGSEQFLAYQRGTVDIGMTGVSGVKSRSLWDVMDTITVTNNADIEFIVLINEDFWQGLDDKQREVIAAAALKAEEDVRNRVSEIEAEAFQAARDHGMTVYIPTADEIEAWKKASAPVIQEWLKTSGEMGKQVLDAAEKL